MLILTRRAGESLRIGDDVEVTVMAVNGSQVRIGIKAPINVSVDREEVAERKRREKEHPMSVPLNCERSVRHADRLVASQRRNLRLSLKKTDEGSVERPGAHSKPWAFFIYDNSKCRAGVARRQVVQHRSSPDAFGIAGTGGGAGGISSAVSELDRLRRAAGAQNL